MRQLSRVLWFLVLIAAVIFVYLQMKERVSENKTEVPDSEVAIGGSFNLTNHLGQEVTEKYLHGKYSIIYFGFTHCPMICPTDVKAISDAMDLLGSKSNLINPVMISIDPERDSSERMKLFLSNYNKNFIGLSGTIPQTKDVLRKYGIYAQKREDEDIEGYDMQHSSYTYLMDKDGKYVTHFPHATDPKEIVKVLEKYL